MAVTLMRTMQHNQYREGLLEKLRRLLLSQPDITLSDARKKLRPTLTEADIDLFFDNWLNANFSRIEVKQLGPGSYTAIIRPRGHLHLVSADEKAEEKRKRDHIAARIAKDTKENLFQSFAAQIWETVLPNGVTLRNAKGRDLQHAQGWFTQLAKSVKPTERVYKKITTRQMFNLSQREI